MNYSVNEPHISDARIELLVERLKQARDEAHNMRITACAHSDVHLLMKECDRELTLLIQCFEPYYVDNSIPVTGR